MNTANLYPQKQTFRFRKWSRKRWAVFHSLGKEVTIGQLIVPANNQALKKQGANTDSSFSFSLQTASEAAPPTVSQDLLLALFICLEILLFGKMPETLPVDNPETDSLFFTTHPVQFCVHAYSQDFLFAFRYV